MIWMTKVELAQYLKKSTRTVERWVVQQKLPPGWRLHVLAQRSRRPMARGL